MIAGGHEGVALHPAAVAEQRHHAGQRQLLVEVGATDMHTAGGEDVVLALGQMVALMGQTHQGEVRGAAANVDDQYQLLAIQVRLVVEGRSYGLVLERHVLETELVRHGYQGVLRFLIGGRVIIDEEYRTAQYHFFEGALGLGFGAFFQLTDEEAEQVLEGQGAAQHGGFSLQQLGAQQAFQRAHQAAFIAFQILVQGQATVDRAALLGVEEDHRG